MQMDSSVLVSLMINVGIILAFSWFGIKLFDRYHLRPSFNDGHSASLASKIVSETAVIIPRLRRKIFSVRRMIKVNSDDDETPYCLPQFS